MEIMYKNPMSIMNLRIDSLAQAGDNALIDMPTCFFVLFF
jgi:hypothetical protein